METWFYAFNGAQQGPVSQDALAQLIASGQLPVGSLVWREGMADWVPASTVPELAAAAAQAASLGAVAPPAYVPAYGVEVQYGGFWLRFAAAIIDGLIIGVPFFVIGLIIQFALGQAPRPGQPPNPAALGGTCFLQIFQILVTWLYFAKMESSDRMATLGKQVCGLKVTDMTGQRISFGRASGRFFGKYLSIITIYIGFMMAGWTQKKQALHDMMANCLVVKK